MHVDMYRVYERQAREAAHAAYISAPEFAGLQQEAERRGFRHATAGELNASAESAHAAADLYCWRGGLWVKHAA